MLLEPVLANQHLFERCNTTLFIEKGMNLIVNIGAKSFCKFSKEHLYKVRLVAQRYEQSNLLWELMKYDHALYMQNIQQAQ